MNEPVQSNAEAWEARYSGDRVWSGQPNALLVQHVAGLVPGRALELGCGEGADAIWLAQQGWQVTATDIAQAGIDRAAAHAAEAGVAGQITFERRDLATELPTGPFELVGSAYLHSMIDFPRAEILRRTAQLVAPGGHLYVIGHAGSPPWAGGSAHAGHHHDLPSAAQTVERLGLGDGWEVLVADDVDVPRRAPDGTPSTRPDCIVLARRLA